MRLDYATVRYEINAPYTHRTPCDFLSVLDELHKNVQVQPVDVPAAEFIRTIPATGQLLLPVPDDAADDIDHLVVDSHHHVDTAHRRADHHCHQRRLRRLRTYTSGTVASGSGVARIPTREG